MPALRQSAAREVEEPGAGQGGEYEGSAGENEEGVERGREGQLAGEAWPRRTTYSRPIVAWWTLKLRAMLDRLSPLSRRSLASRCW